MPKRNEKKKSGSKGIMGFLGESDDKKANKPINTIKTEKSSVESKDIPETTKKISPTPDTSKKIKKQETSSTAIPVPEEAQKLIPKKLESDSTHNTPKEVGTESDELIDLEDEEGDDETDFLELGSEDSFSIGETQELNTTLSSVMKDNYPYLLLTSKYNRDTNKATLFFYDEKTQRLILKDDPTGHESYFIVKLQKDSAQKFLENASNYAEHKHLIKRIEDVSIIDRLFLKNQDRTFTKIISHAPGDVILSHSVNELLTC